MIERHVSLSAEAGEERPALEAELRNRLVAAGFRENRDEQIAWVRDYENEYLEEVAQRGEILLGRPNWETPLQDEYISVLRELATEWLPRGDGFSRGYKNRKLLSEE